MENGTLVGSGSSVKIIQGGWNDRAWDTSIMVIARPLLICRRKVSDNSSLRPFFFIMMIHKH